MYRFGRCVLDVDRRELVCDGASIHLEPQAFDLLVYLVEHRDRVVSKNKLIDGVWGHGHLSDSNLTTRVKEARRAIGDDGSRQESIRNVRGRGYRFVAPTEVVDPRRGSGGPSDLFGRGEELAASADLLARAGVLTLTGPGGVGKSSLAREIAARSAPSFNDGRWVVELASLTPGSSVLPAIARRLDLVVDDDRAEETVRSIARLDALVVLDNCEVLVDEVAELVDELLAVPDAAIRILATSQVRLGLSAESALLRRRSNADSVAWLHVGPASALARVACGRPAHGRRDPIRRGRPERSRRSRCRRSATIWSCRTLPFFAESTGGRSMDEIKGIARVKVHPGKLDEWKRLTEQAMEIVRTRDPGTLQYEVFFNDDESEAIVFERYRDADAALEHFANIGHLMEPLMATATVTGEVLGTPNETMRAQLGDGEPKLFTPWMAAHE